MYTTLKNQTLAILILLSGVVACSKTTGTTTSEEPAADSTETTASTDSEWVYLFDGTSLDGWRAFNGDTLPQNWIIEDGTLKSLGQGGGLGGDIVYAEKEYGEFELALEWKISEGGNSGVFYHIVEDEKYHSPYENAPEYQVIDDIGFPQELAVWQQLGADYGMYVADSVKKKDLVKKAGEWNTSRIKFTNEKAEYFLNGEKMLEFEPWSADWEKRKTEGKWKDYPDYGIAKTGLIGLQDHGSFIWFKNIKIKEL